MTRANLEMIMRIAETHIGAGVMASSARLCLEDAKSCQAKGLTIRAAERACESIAYSVGVFHLSYKRAKSFAGKE